MPNKESKLNVNERIADGRLHLSENIQIQPKITKRQIVSEGILMESNNSGKMVLRPRIEAIHAGRTRNNNIYPSEKLQGKFELKSGIYSFLYPYPKPMIKNHDTESEPTGRIRNAQFIRDSLSGRDSILIVPEITDKETIEKILDGRYLTVSIGASTDSATCNICGVDILSDGWCDHRRGEEYDGVKCGWIVGNLWFDECSWVNVPADSDAMVVDTGEPIMTETYAQVEGKYYNLSAEDDNIEIKEALASSLGLSTEDTSDNIPGEGGLEEVPKIKEDQLQESYNELEGKLNEQLALITEKDEVIAKLEKSILLITKEIETLQETLLTNEEKIVERDSKISGVERQVETLEGENATLRAKIHKDLAEKVLDFKIALAKPVGKTREEAMEEHVARSEESLLDALNDLMIEFNIYKNTSYSGTIKNPGVGAVGGENHSTINGKENNGASSANVEAVYKNLFSGKIK